MAAEKQKKASRRTRGFLLLSGLALHEMYLPIASKTRPFGLKLGKHKFKTDRRKNNDEHDLLPQRKLQFGAQTLLPDSKSIDRAHSKPSPNANWEQQPIRNMLKIHGSPNS
jgi:hypothetical protein